ELDRDPPGAHVRDDRRDRERIDTIGPALLQDVVAVLERLQPADAGGDRSADPLFLPGDRDARVLLGLARRSEDHLREAIHPPRALAVDPGGRIETLELAGEVDAVVGMVEGGDLGRARLPADKRLPRRLDVVPEGRDQAETRDHHAPAAVERKVGTHIPSPPSTSSTSPVMKAASSEQRKGTPPATFPGPPSRPNGVFWSISARISSEISSVSLDVMYPGATTFARTPRLPSSRASDLVKPMIPAFDAA